MKDEMSPSIEIDTHSLSEPVSVSIDTNVETVVLMCQLIVFGVDTGLFEPEIMDDVMNVYESFAYAIAQFAPPFGGSE